MEPDKNGDDKSHIGPPQTNDEHVLATYSFRPNAFVEERQFILTPLKLLWFDGDPSKKLLNELALIDIIELKLRYAPSRFQLSRCTAQAVMRRGGSLLIASGHYQGPGAFEDRTAHYEPFVRALAPALANAHPTAKFTRGYQRSSLLLAAMLSVAALLGLIALSPVVLAVGLPAIVPLAMLVLFSGPAALAEVRRNWPGTYDPRAIPGDLLPGAKTPPHIDPGLAKLARALLRR